MQYPSIRIEGTILSPDILERLENSSGQRPTDFGLDTSVKVKEEIARAWADAQDYWRIFRRKLNTMKPENPATTETRNLWMVPLLGLLGYQLEYQARGVEMNGKNYAISHRIVNRGNMPIHILGYQEPAGLDVKPTNRSGLRMSVHAMTQEYLNLRDELYGIVTNGRVLRLLRESSRLVKLTYLEFDLDRIFNDALYADFALLYRLLHVSRLPASADTASECILEQYHQDSLDFGARIRSGLSRAVEQAILTFANGFLTHPHNEILRHSVITEQTTAEEYYRWLLRLIYRLLFLLVIEERGLIFPDNAQKHQRHIYTNCYSIQRLRRMAEKRHLADPRHYDFWLALLASFQLFEAGGPGKKLGIAPLAGELFDSNAIGQLSKCMLGNHIMAKCLNDLGLYEDSKTGQKQRVNYAALNVEEFGSVYEGLLEFEPVFQIVGQIPEFSFLQGDNRAATGSHYTPDDLVQPLLKHSLDYLIAEKRQEADPAAALLSLRVADIACGSGHILLAAARRIATELAAVRTGEEQPSPTNYRAAVRDVIRECIYGVDLNPLAVELCKVALWLEAHIPGEPLNFLDHHIKCGNAIVGYSRREEIERGVPEEAFVTMTGDDKKIAAAFRKRNKEERSNRGMDSLFTPQINHQLEGFCREWQAIANMPEHTPEEIAYKKKKYIGFVESANVWQLQQLAAIPIAQFYLPKTIENRAKITTDADFRRYWSGRWALQGQATAEAWALAERKRFFHWFLEFPDIIERGGFDCILGNPPYKGGQDLSGIYGHSFCHYVKWEYAPAGLSDLVVYFVRRIYNLLRPGGLTAFITTNSIKDGDIRKDGLEQVIAQGGAINFAVRGIKWPGRANLVVSLMALYKGKWTRKCILDGKDVSAISAYFEGEVDAGKPLMLRENAKKVYQGAIFLGDGFLLSREEEQRLVEINARNQEVIFATINGDELNNQPHLQAKRSVINFHDWTKERAKEYSEPFDIVEQKVKPDRLQQRDKGGREYWWRLLRPRIELFSVISDLERCFVATATTKYLNFSALPVNYVFTHALYVFTTDRWDLYAVVQSTIHEVWARKYSGALETRLRYSPSDCFETFPFLEGLWQTNNNLLAEIGEQYHEFRRTLMIELWLGLTDIYNLFHTRELTPEKVAKVSKKSQDIAEKGYRGILILRNLHKQLDEAIRNAYGWSDLDLGHDFHEVETLPENDRVRYTISPAARKQVLQRLLQLNHERAALQIAPEKGKKKQSKKESEKKNKKSIGLF